MNIFDNPYIFYKSEDTQTWIANSTKLGKLAAEGNTQAQDEIQKAISDTDNIHTLRHSHLSLVIWWANSVDEKQFNFLKQISIKEYIFGILTKDKSLRLNKNLFDSWVASAMIIGFRDAIENKKISLDEMIDFIFAKESNFNQRLKEQGILQSIISCFTNIVTQTISSQQIKKIRDSLMPYILPALEPPSYSNEFIKTSANFIVSLIKLEKEVTAQSKEEFVNSILNIYYQIINKFEQTKKHYYLFLLAELVEKTNITIEEKYIHKIKTVSYLTRELDWNINLHNDKSVYKNWLSYSITKLTDNSFVNKEELSYIIAKALEKLQGDLQSELDFVNGALIKFGISDNNFYPFLRGLKKTFQSERKRYENDIAKKASFFTEGKAKSLSGNNFNSLNKSIAQYKRATEFQVYYMVKLTKTYSPINNRLFKDIASIIIDNIQSSWLMFKMLYDSFCNKEKELFQMECELSNVIREGFHKEVYKNIFRILTSNLQTKLFKTMKDFCIVDEVKEIIALYENLSEYYYLNEENFNTVLRKLDALLDYLPDSLRIYDFLHIDIEMTYQPFLALKRIIFEKRWIDFLLQNNIDKPLNNDIYITEYSKNEIYSQRSILFLQDILSNWQSNRERLFRDIEMDYEERMELLQKNIVLLGELNKSLQELLPTAVYFVHSWVIKKEEERTNQEIKIVKQLINKREKKIALLIDELLYNKKNQDKTTYENDLEQMTILLIFQYAIKTIQKPLAKKLKNYKKICASYIEKYNISFKNTFQFKFNTILISGMILTVGIGYIAPFIMGGNNDFWDFFHDSNWLSVIISSLFMAILSINRLKQIVKKRVGLIAQYDLYENYTTSKRIRFLFIQGLIFAYIIVILGLLVYHPYIKTNFNFTNILAVVAKKAEFTSLFGLPKVAEGTLLENIETICKYLTVFPFTTLFIGLFLENKLED